MCWLLEKAEFGETLNWFPCGVTLVLEEVVWKRGLPNPPPYGDREGLKPRPLPGVPITGLVLVYNYKIYETENITLCFEVMKRFSNKKHSDQLIYMGLICFSNSKSPSW